MTNPFGGNPFGGQKNIFGTSSTGQSGAFGSPVFGQQSSFGQTTVTSTSSSAGPSNNNAGLFGNNPLATTAAPSTMSLSEPQPSSTSSSVFGQRATFGQNQGQTGSFFNRTVDTHSTNTSLFNRSGSGTGGVNSASGTTGSGLFGSGNTTTFSSTTKFTPLFGKVSSQPDDVVSSNPPVFGAGNTATQSAGSTAPSMLFGKPPATAGSNFPSSNPFASAGSSSGFSTTGSNITSSNPFGNSASGFQSSTGSASRSENLFGKPVKQEPTEAGVKKENLFLSSDIKAEKAFGSGSEQANIFRERKTKTENRFESGGSKQSLFGGVAVKQEYTFGGTGVKQEYQAGERGSGLFGKKRTTEQDEGYSGTSMKEKIASGSKDVGLFGKGRHLTKTLFGKPVAQDDTKDPATVASDDRDDNDEEENPVGQRESGKSSARKLFGKTVREEEKPSRSTGLFGKPAVSRERLNSSEDKDARSSVRRQISEDMSSKVAIVCRNVPTKYNSILTLRNHFKKFGEVTKVFPNQGKMQATVHFRTHEAANEAKRRGRILARGIPPMTIYWSSYQASATPRASRSSLSTDEKSSRSLKRTSDADLLPRSKRTSWQSTDIVSEELDSMAGTHDMKTQVTDLPRSPEKRSRGVSPSPSTSAAVPDIKQDKIQISMFEGVVARTNTDRAQLLTLRDKYIRQNREKGTSDIVKAFVGTCPDMCPEKERYDREDKRQLSYYEIIPGTENIPGRNPQVDHGRAVKEYLRSSPDQDEPLPHELRPLPVLQATMTYLLQEVVDRGEDGRWGDWFDFLWNRTRGIRKDIIQQQLNDRGAVDLIEKCARFHIYCSERLCEEDMHSFDAKINNENLTKCLQTLREFYADLEKKQKCFCVNEAEFRAYTVLMNLNEGDILREVQQLRPEIRTSPQIKLALNAYFALNNNNYIKFFRLVKQASFTNACIMHRYFRQVRSRALTLMMKGYRLGNRPAQIPVKELVRLLAFENDQEAATFLMHYGFRISDGEVTMDRSDYIEPETALPPSRSINLIESKLLVSVGELINGGPFPNTGHLSPTSSFDEQGRFHSSVQLPKAQKSSIAGPSQSTSYVPPQQEQQQTAPVEVTPQPQIVEEKPSLKKIPVELIKDSAKVLFWEVIEELCRGISQEVKSEIDDKLLLSEEILESIITEGLLQETRNISTDVHRAAEIERYKALQVELEQRKDRVAESLTDIILHDLVIQEVLNLATIEMREVKAQLRHECIQRVTVDINADLVEEVMTEMVEEISEDVFEVDVRQRLKQLDDLEKLVKLSRAARFLRRWKAEYKAVTKLKRAMEEFPCAPSMQCTTEQLQALIVTDNDSIVDKKFYVNKRAKLTIESPLEIEKRRKQTDVYVLVHQLYKNLLHQTAWGSLDVGRLVGRQLVRKNKITHKGFRKGCNLFWKLLVCLPDVDQSDSEVNQSDRTTAQLCHWLKMKFSKGSPPPTQNDVKGEVLSLYKCQLPEKAVTDQHCPGSVGICVRTVEGQLDPGDILAVEEEALFLGTSALLFVLPAGAPLSNSKSTYRQYWSAQQSRLEAVLEVKPDYQGFPLVIVVPVGANESLSCEQIIEHLQLADLLDRALLSEVDVVTYTVEADRLDGIDFLNPAVSERLCESIQWLAEKTQPAQDLRVQYLKDVLDVILQKHYYTNMQHNLKKRKELGRLDKDPYSLIELYNSVIIHVSEVLTSDTLYTVSWPVSEFTNKHNSALPPKHWNKGDHLDHVLRLVESLCLPEFDCLDTEDWYDVKKDLWAYISSFAGTDYSGARVKLFSRLKKLLHSIEVDFAEACNFQYGEPDCLPFFVNIPWSTFISLCIDYKLDTLDLVDPETSNSQADREELRVAYIEDEMDSFKLPKHWQHLESDKAILDTASLEDTVQKAVNTARTEREKNAVKTEISIIEDPLNVSTVTIDTRKTSSSLISSLKAERRQSDHFQKYLENALQDNQSKNNSSLTEDFSFSVFESNNQSFGAGNLSVFSHSRRFSLEPCSSERHVNFDATAYFNQTNNISAIFDPVDEGRSLLPSNRRKSDIGLHELMLLPGKKRRERLSEVYNNDPVMMYLREPTMKEDVDNFRENLKSSRRESDLFEKKLRMILQNQPETF